VPHRPMAPTQDSTSEVRQIPAFWLSDEGPDSIGLTALVLPCTLALGFPARPAPTAHCTVRSPQSVGRDSFHLLFGDGAGRLGSAATWTHC
jgi:hypothetical protein